MKGPGRIVERSRKLALLECGRAYRFEEAGGLSELNRLLRAAVLCVRIHDAYRPPQVACNQRDWCLQVRVVGDHYGYIKHAAVSIVDQVRSQVHIRPFLLLPEDQRKLRLAARGQYPAAGRGQGKSLRMRQVVPVVDLYFRESRKRPQICLLPHGRVGLARARSHSRREILDSLDVIARKQDAAKGGEVEPPMRRPLKCAIVEVEAVDVYPGPRRRKGRGGRMRADHQGSREYGKKAEAARRRPRARSPKQAGGIVLQEKRNRGRERGQDPD